MATTEGTGTGAGCEKAVTVLMFDDLSVDEQIQKLRFELQCATRAISRIGNESSMLHRHQHSRNGNVVIDIADRDKVFTPDRGTFLK